MNANKVWVILVPTAILAACQAMPGKRRDAGKTSGPARMPIRLEAGDPLEGMVRHFGYLDVTRNKTDGSQEFEAAFATFDNPTDVRKVIKNFAVALPDSCETSTRARPVQIIDELNFPDDPYRFVVAGMEIPVQYKGRRYARLTPSESDNGIEYETAMSGVAATIGGIHLFNVFVRSDSLSVRIPGGADFPAVGSMAIPPVDRFTGFTWAQATESLPTRASDGTLAITPTAECNCLPAVADARFFAPPGMTAHSNCRPPFESG